MISKSVRPSSPESSHSLVAAQRGAVGPSLALACGGEYVIDDEAYETADRGRTAT